MFIESNEIFLVYFPAQNIFMDPVQGYVLRKRKWWEIWKDKFIVIGKGERHEVHDSNVFAIETEQEKCNCPACRRSRTTH